MRTVALVLAAASIATCVVLGVEGCGSTYRPDTTAAPDGSNDGATLVDAGADALAPADASACAADLKSDAKNCGRCGHDCLGGACTAGRCEAFEISATGAPLRRIIATDSALFVSSFGGKAGDASGIWRVPKSGGQAEVFVPSLFAATMGILDGTLYFVVFDAPADGAGAHGGLYSCPAAAAAPCMPTLIAPSNQSVGLSIDGGRVFYTDGTSGKGLMVYAPGTPPTTFLSSDPIFGSSIDVYVDGQKVFLTTSAAYALVNQANLLELGPDGGIDIVYDYAHDQALAGRLLGTPTALFFSAYDFTTTTGGVVHRVPRGGSTIDCDFGGGGNRRPLGLYVDDARVYWVNQGIGDAPAYTGSSVASCPLAGCCSTPDVLWTGGGLPTDMAGDTDAVYFVGSESGSIWKLAKP